MQDNTKLLEKIEENKKNLLDERKAFMAMYYGVIALSIAYIVRLIALEVMKDESKSQEDGMRFASIIAFIATAFFVYSQVKSVINFVKFEKKRQESNKKNNKTTEDNNTQEERKAQPFSWTRAIMTLGQGLMVFAFAWEAASSINEGYKNNKGFFDTTANDIVASKEEPEFEISTPEIIAIIGAILTIMVVLYNVFPILKEWCKNKINGSKDSKKEEITSKKITELSKLIEEYNNSEDMEGIVDKIKNDALYDKISNKIQELIDKDFEPVDGVDEMMQAFEMGNFSPAVKAVGASIAGAIFAIGMKKISIDPINKQLQLLDIMKFIVEFQGKHEVQKQEQEDINQNQNNEVLIENNKQNNEILQKQLTKLQEQVQQLTEQIKQQSQTNSTAGSSNDIRINQNFQSLTQKRQVSQSQRLNTNKSNDNKSVILSQNIYKSQSNTLLSIKGVSKWIEIQRNAKNIITLTPSCIGN